MASASWLANVSATRETLELFGLSTRHSLGQHFLVDDSVVRRILEFADLSERDRVLEIGPGMGTLTIALLDTGAFVVAVEKDSDLVPVLKSVCAPWLGPGDPRLEICQGDALKLVNAGLGRKWLLDKLVSNLPYAIGAKVLLQAFCEMDGLEQAVVMVQQEVADRMAARPGTKSYGAYTVKLALLAEVEGRFNVAPGCFFPPPRVWSSVVSLRRVRVLDDSLRRVMAVVTAAFAQRRKTLRNNLLAAGYGTEQVDGAIERLGLKPAVRAETLEPARFEELAEALEAFSSD